MRPSRSILRARPGFTLIELVVTISIIAILVALTVFAAAAMLTRSETQRTQDMFKLLDMGVAEWEQSIDRRVTFGMNNQPFTGSIYDIDENQFPTMKLKARQFFRLIERSETAKDMLKRIDSKLLRRAGAGLPGFPADGYLEVRDAWGDWPIPTSTTDEGVSVVVIFPGREWNPNGPTADSAADRDADGTLRTQDEKTYGVALNRQVLFVSAGPDGQFGDLNQPATTAAYKFTIDNVYSYQPGKPR